MANEFWDMLSFDHGAVAIVERDNQIVRVCFESSEDDILKTIEKRYPCSERSSQTVLNKALDQITEYFCGTRRTFLLPLHLSSLTPFACRVHQELLNVPFGETISYGGLANKAGSPKAARAIGRVMSSNPYPLVVPCHRVVNADGKIGHYSAAAGTKTKSWLIDFEQKLCK